MTTGTLKRAWSRPELTIVARGAHEEAVLTVCKDNMFWGGTPNYDDVTCTNTRGACEACSALAAS